MTKNTHEVKCPNCKTAFVVDGTGYADIMRQIRDAEFDAELQSRLRDADQARATEIKLAQAEIEMQHAAERSQQLQEISRLESVLKSAEAERELELTKALADLSSKADKLKNELELSAAQKELDLQNRRHRSTFCLRPSRMKLLASRISRQSKTSRLLAKLSSSTVNQSSTASGLRRSPLPTSKRTTIPRTAPRATTSSAISQVMRLRRCQLCST